MKKYFTLFILLFLIACQSNHTLKVTEVIDGDTVRLSNGKTLRYLGIDTPELTRYEDGIFVSDPQPYSRDAAELNRKLVEGKSIRIEYDVQRQDKYGRILGYCFCGDTFVNAELLKQGAAVLYTRPPNVKYTDFFLGLQLKARSQQRGLWGRYGTITSDEADNYVGQIRTVRGRVLDTYRSEKMLFLNFGSNYRNDFTVVIFNDCLTKFWDEKSNFDQLYRGKRIEVTGRIRKYNGPEIIVCVPGQIDIISEQHIE